jgi:hypothetical protein
MAAPLGCRTGRKIKNRLLPGGLHAQQEVSSAFKLKKRKQEGNLWNMGITENPKQKSNTLRVNFSS